MKILSITVLLFSGLVTYSQDTIWLSDSYFYLSGINPKYNLFEKKFFQKAGINVIFENVEDSIFHKAEYECSGTLFSRRIYRNETLSYEAFYSCVYRTKQKLLGGENFYINDKLILTVYYGKNEQPYKITLRSNSEEINILESVSINGAIKEINFKDVIIEFNSNRVETIFSKTDGKFTSYHDNMVVRKKGCIKNENRVGEWIEYHSNGRVKSIGSYSGKYKVINDSMTLDSAVSILETDTTKWFIPLTSERLEFIKIGKWRYFNLEGELTHEVFY